MIRLLAGDCRDVLPTLSAESVQCCITSPPYYALRSYLDAAHPDKHREIGSEPTPDEYLATMVGVFREVRRVLRRDGTCWVNMGDSYASGEVGRHDHKQAAGICVGDAAAGRVAIGNGMGAREQRALSTGLPAKNLLLMPARLALALQADGWWVRSDVIWHKPNPMPESCTDRPTSAHEHVFLLTRSARYFYDADAVREEAEYGASIDRDGAACGPFRSAAMGGAFRGGTRAHSYGGSRNLRNVWSIATHAYSAAHFATFPPELAERCIKAGTSERGCCAACGKPWGRVTERETRPGSSPYRNDAASLRSAGNGDRNDAEDGRSHSVSTTTGWSPGCQCDAEAVPCTVLDPFAGAGTTLLVADRLQRDAIGVELNVAYTEMAMERCRADAPLFTSFPPAEDPEESRMADLFAEAAE